MTVRTLVSLGVVTLVWWTHGWILGVCAGVVLVSQAMLCVALDRQARDVGRLRGKVDALVVFRQRDGERRSH